MTAWVVFGVLVLWKITKQAAAARRAARRPPFVSWVRDEALPVPPSPPADVEVAWTALDDRQLERLLSDSSS